MIFNLSLTNFRSFKNESFEFSPGVNLVVGPNAIGKTNLIEAVVLICNQKSFRLKGQNLINHDHSFFKLQAIDQYNYIRQLVYKIENDKIDKKFFINSLEINSKDKKRNIPTVIFEPNFLNLINGSSDKRRLFLDNLNSNLYLDYYSDLLKYKKIINQRNSLLKNYHSSNKDFFPWNIRLVEVADRIIKRRLSLVDRFNQEISQIYNLIANNKKYTITIDYKTQFQSSHYSNKLLYQLENNLEKEKQYGYTLFGPHHDDIRFYFNNKEVKNLASRGEIRTLVLVLKIIEAKLIENNNQLYKPILLLDDVFSELDGSRRKYLTEYFKDYQIFITTTDADVVIKDFSKTTNLILLN